MPVNFEGINMKTPIWAITGILLFIEPTAHGFAGGAGTCEVTANFSTITSMNSRTRNENPGNYTVTSNMETYTPGQSLDLTLAGPTFTGVMFSVVDGSGTAVGTFGTDAQVRGCNGTGMSVTHTSGFGSVMSKTLTWTAPATDVGPVYVLGYVLSGTRGNTASQEFFRFVRDDDSALEILPPDIFTDGFEE